jgi:hypothetical protein
MKRLVCLMAVASALFGVLESSAVAGTVEGTVTPVQWAQEVEVCAIGVEAYERCAVPKADGSYVYAGILGSVAIEFIPTYRSRLLTQYWDHARALSEATYITLGNGDIHEGINADLLEGGSITGVVTAQGGGGRLPEVEVCAVPVPPLTSKSCDETNASGEYSLHSLTSGGYRVGFWGQAGSAEYEPTYYEDESNPVVEVTAGQATVGIDAALVKGGQISGRVLSADGGTPLNDIAVCVFSGAEAISRRCTDSGEAGNYAFQGLSSGSYQVGFSLEASEIGGSGEIAGADSFESQYYDGVAARAQAATISLLVPETVEGIDAHLSGISIAPPSVIAPIVSGPPSTSTVVVPEPGAKMPRCKKPKRKVKVAGKIRCVKPSKHRKPKRHRTSRKSGDGWTRRTDG